MEIETNTPPSDEARLLAQSKKLTLQPVHTDIEPEDVPDSVIVAQHLAGGTVGNIDIDTEQNVAPIQPVDSSSSPVSTTPTDQKSLVRLWILTIIGFLLFAAVLTAVIIQL